MSFDEPNQIINRRSPEWAEQHERHKWLLDSLEGGERYRRAEYGEFSHDVSVPKTFAGDTPTAPAVVAYEWAARRFRHRNLVRHPREYPTDKEGEGEDYLLRLERTPVPTFMSEAIETHLSKIYSREVDRDGPDKLKAWWKDVDGQGTSIDDWMTDTLAPLLLAIGHVDVLADHPPAPPGETIETQADVNRLGIGGCVIAPILSENVVYWETDPQDRYVECQVAEFGHTDKTDVYDKPVAYHRVWTATESVLYDDEDVKVPGQTIPHRFGQVPIRRLYDRRKVRCKHTGQPRYEPIAERQREYYNADSELILANTLQVHPLLQAPEELFQGTATVPVGPSYVLPMKKSGDTYTAWEVLDFPTTGVEFIEKKLARLRDEIYQYAKILKPAGSAIQGSGQVVAQSGVSKQMDQSGGNDLLSKIAKVLEKAEKAIAEMALMVLADGPPDPADVEKIRISYPSEFDLYTADDVANATLNLQKIMQGAGALPVTEGEYIQREVRLALPGLADDKYTMFDEEIDAALKDKAQAKADASAALQAARATPPLGSPGAPAGPTQAGAAQPPNPLDSVTVNATPVGY